MRPRLKLAVKTLVGWIASASFPERFLSLAILTLPVDILISRYLLHLESMALVIIRSLVDTFVFTVFLHLLPRQRTSGAVESFR
jgi:hypothetical protein